MGIASTHHKLFIIFSLGKRDLAGIYLLKISQICLKLMMTEWHKWRCFGVFLINFGHIWHLDVLLKLNMYLLAGDAITLAAGSNHRQNFIQICWKGVIYIPCIAQKSAKAVHLRKKFSPQKSLHFAWWQLSYGNAVLKNFINLTEITHDGIFSFKSFRLKGCWVTIKCLCVRLFLLNFFQYNSFSELAPSIAYWFTNILIQTGTIFLMHNENQNSFDR